ncbi:MAG: glycosyltransferase [Candidatus Hydrogenedentes bacterium]|nr:glycosyltransferase [Candidatus Hydrogenedentota bacterium]
MPVRPTFSVVIPACDEERYLPACLAGIERAAARLDEPVEVVVADNMSRDGTAAMARERGAAVVSVEEKCLSVVRNRGAAAATGRYLVFIDADSIMSDGMLVTLKDVLDSGRYIGGGVAHVRPDRLSLGILCSILCFAPFAIWRIRASAVVFYTTPEAFNELGGFDERLYAVEDIDFANRMRALGKRRGLRYKNLLRAYVTTSTRKFDEFGDWFVLRHPIRVWKAFRNDREVAHDLWYRPRR